jgi:hypothetical protein
LQNYYFITKNKEELQKVIAFVAQESLLCAENAVFGQK